MTMMRADDERSEELYFEHRAEAELMMASASDDPAACRAHYELATLYLDRVHPPAPAEAQGDVLARADTAEVD